MAPTTVLSPPTKKETMAKQYWYTQEILFLTEHFGKQYFYMKDVDGHIYGVRAKEDEHGNLVPDLT